MEKYTTKPFLEALGEILVERYGDKMGQVRLGPFIELVAEQAGWSREYVRLQLREDRPLRTEVVEAAAKALEISPHYFYEYRKAWVHWQMEAHPEVTEKLHEVALGLVETLSNAKGHKRGKTKP